ncbi:MAG: hypothetical protein Kow0098_12440 [Ignavibacteriaceae bacterium]
MKSLFTSLLVILPLVLNGCYKRPSPIPFGEANCDYCGSIIANPKFGAEMLVKNNKNLFFDSFECLIRLRNSQKYNSSQIISNWVIDFSHPGELIYVPSAYFLKADRVKSPSGLNILAFADESDLESVLKKSGGEKMRLQQVINYVKLMDSMVSLR